MKQIERAIQHKLQIIRYAEEVGSTVKACRYFGIGSASICRWKVLYKNGGEAVLVNKKSVNFEGWVWAFKVRWEIAARNVSVEQNRRSLF